MSGAAHGGLKEAHHAPRAHARAQHPPTHTHWPCPRSLAAAQRGRGGRCRGGVSAGERPLPESVPPGQQQRRGGQLRAPQARLWERQARGWGCVNVWSSTPLPPAPYSHPSLCCSVAPGLGRIASLVALESDAPLGGDAARQAGELAHKLAMQVVGAAPKFLDRRRALGGGGGWRGCCRARGMRAPAAAPLGGASC